MTFVEVVEFLFEKEGPIFDARSPCEFARGHIPGSISFPLFLDEERAQIGTIYKHSGHDPAVMMGLGIVGPKLKEMAVQFKRHMRENQASTCRLLCYRGGMRSASLQWLFDFLRFPCVRLSSGYKGYRSYVLNLFEKPYKFICIGGSTGSGKTIFLKKLISEGHQVVDLESLANHRGSAFGLLPNQEQPTNEQFENLIVQALSTLDSSRPIFIEDESRSIGSCVIPKILFEQISQGPLIWLDVSKEDRLERVVEQYGSYSLSWLTECTRKLSKRLGGARVEAICQYIEKGLLFEAARELLSYYDATYQHSLHTRARVIHTATVETFLSVVRQAGIAGA